MEQHHRVVWSGKAPPCKMASLDFLIELEETGRVIGRGAYGEVLELLLHGTKVAGKKINCEDRETDIKSRIEQQCNRLAIDVIELHYILSVMRDKMCHDFE